MVKKLIFIFALCLIAEALMFTSVLGGFKRAQALPAESQTSPPASPIPLDQAESLVLVNENYRRPLTLGELASLAPTDSWEKTPQEALGGYLLQAVGGRQGSWKRQVNFNEQSAAEVILALEKAVNRPVQNSQLIVADSRATTFAPHLAGQILDLGATRQVLLRGLRDGEDEIALPVVRESPATRLADLNDLGIRELLVRGQTDFSGSSASRIQNVKVGASQYRGLIIPKGAEFSFNDNLGPIDAAHGYRPELVIKPEGTVPEFGGGLCQVSSTAFRAAFFAGLPITQRRNHSYAVAYYEWISDDRPRAAGLDATIYPGAQDLKFVNDTPGAILIWTSLEGTRLYFDFYGTPDGRKVAMEGPEIYDRRASGALKAKVVRTIESATGEIQELMLNSNYVSPNLFPRVFEYPPPVPPPAPPPESPAPAPEQTTNEI